MQEGHQNLRAGLITAILAMLVIAFVLLAIWGVILGSSFLLSWVSVQACKADPTIVAALITGAGALLGALFISFYSATQAQRRAAEEANRGRKAAIYNEFVTSLIAAGERYWAAEGDFNADEMAFASDFASQILVNGGPDVVKAYRSLQTLEDLHPFEWNPSGQANRKVLTGVERLLLEMRAELGISNKGIKEGEIVRLIFPNKRL